MSLETGKRIHRHGWIVLPITKEVLLRVNYLGKKQKQSRVASNFKYSCNNDAQENNIQLNYYRKRTEYRKSL